MQCGSPSCSFVPDVARKPGDGGAKAYGRLLLGRWQGRSCENRFLQTILRGV